MSDEEVIKPLSFVETENMFIFPPIPILIAINETLRSRPLWQEGNAEVKPMLFIDADDDSCHDSAASQLKSIRESTRPTLKRSASVYDLSRKLWQVNAYKPLIQSSESSSESSGAYSRDDEMEVDIKAETEIPKIIFDIGDLPYTSNGVRSECELSRTIEEANQFEKPDCTKQ